MATRAPLSRLWQERGSYVLALAPLCGGALLCAYHLPAKDSWGKAYACAAGWLLSFIDPSVSISGAVINSKFPMRITESCVALEVKALLVVAVLAFPAAWWRRGVGVLAGLLAIVAMNVVRLCSLYLVGRFWRPQVHLFHLYVWPAILVLYTLCIFLLWSRWATLKEAQRDAV